jgi:hypothetical protein
LKELKKFCYKRSGTNGVSLCVEGREVIDWKGSVGGVGVVQNTNMIYIDLKGRMIKMDWDELE